MLTAHAILRRHDVPADAPLPFDLVVLDHQARHIRRKRITLQHGDDVLVDLPTAEALEHGDRLVLADGRHAEIVAAEEPLLAIAGRDREHLMALCWHLGNRHLAAAIEPDRILILRDHVMADMLVGLGAQVSEVVEPFEPMRGAYHGHGHEQGRHGHHAH